MENVAYFIAAVTKKKISKKTLKVHIDVNVDLL